VKVLGGARTKRRGRIADPGDLHTGPWGGQIHQVLLQLEGVDSPEAASLLRGYSIEVPAAEAWPLPPGTFYTYQILNLPLVTAAGASIGTLAEVLTTGSNDVYVVRTPGGKELLVPAIREIVEEINPAEGYIRIKDPAEWMDIEEG
jgi:16S rRNA processing protein RimM